MVIKEDISLGPKCANQTSLRAIKLKILRGMPVGIRGRHPIERFAERIGVRRTESVIRLLKKAIEEGEFISSTPNDIHLLHNHRLFKLVLAIDPTDGQKKLFPKTVMLENSIEETPLFVGGKYKGKTIKKSNFRLCA